MDKSNGSDTDLTDLKVIFCAGALSGLVVDIALHPLDTLKTRAQSRQGFWKNGGFHGVYRGVGATAFGAAPTAALFFLSYEAYKNIFGNRNNTERQEFTLRMYAAAFAETCCSVTKVPTEVIKQRAQTGCFIKSFEVFRLTLMNQGIYGLYHGFWVTVLRDTPFSIVQYPLWELFKNMIDCDSPAEGALCGAVAGAIAGIITTPLDVLKTRIMLSRKPPPNSRQRGGESFVMMKEIWVKKGFQGFYAGFFPRTIWLFLGSFLYFGTYETGIVYFEQLFDIKK